MKSVFFLKNNTHTGDYQTNAEFLKTVEKMVSFHHLNARVYPAAWCEGKKENERYGVAVEVEYPTAEAMLKIAENFKKATAQEHILLNSKAENPPVEFIPGKIAVCRVSGNDSASLVNAIHNIHLKQKELLAQKGKNTAVLLFQTENAVCLQAVSNPVGDASYDYWQKVTGEFLRDINLKPEFTMTNTLFL